RIKGNMQLLKVDADTKEPLDGIDFKVTCEDGFMKGQSWDLTTENGLISLKDLELGKYRVDEIKTDWNHVLNNEPLYFEITENGKTVKLEMENRKIRGTAELIKIDAETKRPLEGAKF
ncbi:SpaA isopeptide-forming pilin-related protein, partial [Clostridium perfringens]|nr:SpaA isopeptide-forming pilin-related protein [Clostridium perfringens]